MVVASALARQARGRGGGGCAGSLFSDRDGALGLLHLTRFDVSARWHTPTAAVLAIVAAAAVASPPLPLRLFCAHGATLALAELPAPPFLIFFPLIVSPQETLCAGGVDGLIAAAHDPAFAGFVGGPPGRALFVAAVDGAGNAQVLDPHCGVAAEQRLTLTALSPRCMAAFSSSVAAAFFLPDKGARDAWLARVRGTAVLSIAVVEVRVAPAAAVAAAANGEAQPADGSYDFGELEGGPRVEWPLRRARWGANLAHRLVGSLRTLARAWGLL